MCGIVKQHEAAEFFGSIIDVFEDFLEEKGIDIYNPEKEDDPDIENAAIIYGTDYDDIRSRLADIMYAWRIIQND